MEGITNPKRFRKSNFYGSSKSSSIKIKTQETLDLSKVVESSNQELDNFSEHTNNSIDKLDLPVLSQTSTQPDIPMILKSDTYTMEESEAEISVDEEKVVDDVEKVERISMKNKKKLEILTDLQKNSTYTCEEDDSASSSDNEEEIPLKRLKKNKKVYRAPLKKLNKMVDITQEPQVFATLDYDIKEEDEIEIEVQEKQKSNKFFEKIKLQSEKSEKINYFFAKSVLTEKTTEENLEVKAPEKLVGFFLRKTTLTARDSLREQLRNEIINRKTTHIMPEHVFSKSSTELVGKTKKIENESDDDDYIPNENEVSEAMELEKMIRLEEGEEPEAESENSDESENTENSGSLEESLETESESLDNERNEECNDTNQPTPYQSPKKPIFDSPLSKTSECQLISTAATETFDKSTVSKSDDKRLQIDPSTAASDYSPVLSKQVSRSAVLSKFIEKEAEIGSDHEEHDDLIKHLKDSESEADLDHDLEEIIDRQAVDEQDDTRYEKHLNQLLKDDEDQIKKVINAEFRKQRKDFDFVGDDSNILNKKQQLLDEKKKIIQSRGLNAFGFRLDDQVELEGIDDDELGKYQVLKTSQELKVFRSHDNSKKIIDDQSLSLLSLISKPDNTVQSKSLLSDNEKSSSVRVFKTCESFSSNRNFVFSKEKKKSFQVEKTKPRNTKLFSLFSR